MTTFTWTANLTMRKKTGKKIDFKDDIVQDNTTRGTRVFTLDFIESAAEPEIFRGGTLQLLAKADIGGELSGKTPNLRIEGTNPLRTAIQTRIDAQVQTEEFGALQVADVQDVLKRIACFESGGQIQFRAPANGGIGPVLIAPDNGVGIFQITTTDRCPDLFTVCPEVLFDWRANVAEGVRTYQDKVAIARRYPNRILRRAPAYRRFIEETINPMRKRNGLVPIPPDDLPAPAFTATGRIGATPPNQPNQLLEDAVRGYNGFEGTAYGRALHEFVPNETFLATQPLRRLYTDFRVWRRVPAAERVQSDSDGQYKGDAAYYNHVSKTLPHCGGDE